MVQVECWPSVDRDVSLADQVAMRVVCPRHFGETAFANRRLAINVKIIEFRNVVMLIIRQYIARVAVSAVRWLAVGVKKAHPNDTSSIVESSLQHGIAVLRRYELAVCPGKRNFRVVAMLI